MTRKAGVQSSADHLTQFMTPETLISVTKNPLRDNVLEGGGEEEGGGGEMALIVFFGGLKTDEKTKVCPLFLHLFFF